MPPVAAAGWAVAEPVLELVVVGLVDLIGVAEADLEVVVELGFVGRPQLEPVLAGVVELRFELVAYFAFVVDSFGPVVPDCYVRPALELEHLLVASPFVASYVAAVAAANIKCQFRLQW